MNRTISTIFTLAATIGVCDAALVLHSTLDDADISGSTVVNSVGVDGSIIGTLDSVEGREGEGRAGYRDANFISYGNNFGPGTGNYTVSLWYKLDSGASVAGADFLAGKGNNSSQIPGWSIFAEGTKLIVRADAVGGNSSTNLGLNHDLAADGNWHQVAFKLDHDAGLLTAYHDGLSSGAGTDNGWAVGLGGADINTFTSGDDFGNSDDLLFGRRLTTGAPFNTAGAGLDDLQIYDHALSDAQVTQLFNNPGVAIPEPSSAALFVLGGVAAILRRGRSH